jgi:hypothetical protein
MCVSVVGGGGGEMRVFCTSLVDKSRLFLSSSSFVHGATENISFVAYVPRIADFLPLH